MYNNNACWKYMKTHNNNNNPHIHRHTCRCTSMILCSFIWKFQFDSFSCYNSLSTNIFILQVLENQVMALALYVVWRHLTAKSARSIICQSSWGTAASHQWVVPTHWLLLLVIKMTTNIILAIKISLSTTTKVHPVIRPYIYQIVQ